MYSRSNVLGPAGAMTQRERRILIVDDDPELRGEISTYLSEKGFLVFGAEDALAMDDCFEREAIDLMVLDIGLPGENGLSICERLSRRGGVAIIVASAAGEERDRVRGLDLGADDYLPKPFSPRELLARVQAVLRRQESSGAGARGAVYLFGGFSYDPARRHLKTSLGDMIPLTGVESSLLGTLLLNPRVVMSREALLCSAQTDMAPDSRAVDLQISRLRRKLQVHGKGGLITTQRGLGYLLECDVTRQ